MKKILFVAVTAITIVVLVVSYLGLVAEFAAIYGNPADAEWQLTVTGLVEHPLNMAWAEIIAMPRSIVSATLFCVGMPNYAVAQGNWVGVRLWLLLERAGVSPEAIKVAFYASDGFSTDLTVQEAMREDIIVAYEKDGAPLSEKLRLVVPEKWGYKWISQIVRIELVDYDFKGFWESRGYSDEATITQNGTVPEVPPNIPEFPPILILLIPVILMTLIAAIVRKKVERVRRLSETSVRLSSKCLDVSCGSH
jgi:DMSO/TMAO reductase YedYZ molybdopterin-dependent catalytic subunit